MYKFARCKRLLDLCGGMPIRRAYVYSTQTHKWQTHVTSQEELSVVRKTDLNKLHNLLSEREILKLRKNNLLENIAINNINENLESASNKTCHCREETRNVQTAYQKNWQSTQKTGTTTNEISGEKIQPKIINLSKHHLTEFQILLLTKGATFCPTTKWNVFVTKSDTKTFTRKSKLRETYGLYWGKFSNM